MAGHGLPLLLLDSPALKQSAVPTFGVLFQLYVLRLEIPQLHRFTALIVRLKLCVSA